MKTSDAQNIVLGAGYVYFDLINAAGALTGERYLGDTPGFDIQAQTTTQQVYSSDGPIAEKILDVATQINRSAAITCRNVSDANLALFVIGEATNVDQAADAVTGETHDVRPGRYYQLGQTATNPVGARKLDSVTVTIDPDGTATAASLDSDYRVDPATGRLYVEPGGAIAAAIAAGEQTVTIGVDYTPAEARFGQITTSQTGAKEGAIRYVADNTAGANRDVYIPRAQLQPDGTISWKSRDTVASMAFNAGILKQDSLAQLYINGRPA